jgi:hypothetical protein
MENEMQGARANKAERSRFRKAALAGVAVAAVAATAFANLGNAQDKSIQAAIYRVTAEQYKNIIADVFGRSVTIGGRFEPGMRVDGLIASGASVASVSGSSLEQYDNIARDVADQVTSEKLRATLLPCTPAAKSAPDDACASQFFSAAGQLLFRRPLTGDELKKFVDVANKSAVSAKNFYTGVASGLSMMLVAPEFLFWREIAVPTKDGYELDPYSKATKLSFFLWNSAPDEELLRAAGKGELDTEKGLRKQVDRLLHSPRLEAGVRAFFEDYLHFDAFANVAKDAAIYPNFTSEVSDAAQEQTLRTIVDHLLVRNGDYRDLFTTRHTFVTPLLGTVYGVPVAKDSPNGAPDDWRPYEYPATSPQAGILTHASFLSLHSHPGRSSPTIRGKALREVFLCQKVPDPPGNVEFNILQDTTNPVYKTAKARLDAHATEAMCTGCHKITDPLGLALENFDTASAFRTRENGEVLDTKGTLDGIAFTDAPSLGKALHDHPRVSKCFTQRMYQYGIGRQISKADNAWIETLTKDFAQNGYRVRDLLRSIVLSDKFYEVRALGQQASLSKGE